MLKDGAEAEIVKTALEPGIREANRECRTFDRIVRTFFSGVDLQNKRVVDLGPGHYEFLEIMRNVGALCEAIEIDPAVVALGHKRGFVVHEENLRDLPSDRFGGRYDGVFCRCSINPFWFVDHPSAVEDYVKHLVSLGKPDAWFWISPCVIPPHDCPPDKFRAVVKAQEEAYRKAGFEVWHIPNKVVGSWFGVYGSYGSLKIFYKNLPRPRFSMADVPELVRFVGYHGAKVLRLIR